MLVAKAINAILDNGDPDQSYSPQSGEQAWIDEHIVQVDENYPVWFFDTKRSDLTKRFVPIREARDYFMNEHFNSSHYNK